MYEIKMNITGIAHEELLMKSEREAIENGNIQSIIFKLLEDGAIKFTIAEVENVKKY